MDVCFRLLWLHSLAICAFKRYARTATQAPRGSFIVHTIKHIFSSVALDHMHKQVNVLAKGEGGAVGLTQDPAALQRWMIGEFESLEDGHNCQHHEQNPRVQSAFTQYRLHVISAFEELNNPFAEEGPELMALHLDNNMDDRVM